MAVGGMPRSPQRRWLVWGIGIAAGGGFLGIWVRLLQLQVFSAEELRQRVRAQAYVRLQLLPTRGDITDMRGEVLATSVEAPSYGVDPVMVRCPECLCRQVQAVLGLRAAECLERIAAARGRFLWLRRGVWGVDTRALDTLDEPGLVKLRERVRVYIHGELFLPALGAVGVDQQGLSGLELACDSLLRREGGTLVMRRTARGHLLPTVEQALAPRAIPPALRTTLHTDLQRIVAYELAQGVVRAQASSGLAIALEPATGAVRAFVAVPPPPRGSAHAPLVSDAYEPGSVLKPIIAAVALEAGVVRPSDTLDGHNGRWTVGGHQIVDEYPLRSPTLREALAYSSNVVFAQLGQRLPVEVLVRGIRAFGFGRPTGIGLPGEAAGIVPKVEEFRPETPLFWGFGYGLAVTPLQLACAYAALANDGVLVRPRLLEALLEPQTGKVLRVFPPEPGVRVITAETARRVRKLLTAVVEEGTGRRAHIPGIAIAGKTGTAQQLVAGRYSRQAHTASFVAMVPAERPQLVVLIMLVRPRQGSSGGQVAAPILRAILQRMTLHPELSRYIFTPSTALNQHSS